MADIANKQVICDVLLEAAKKDKDIVVLCSDSRGSASASAYAKEMPEQFVEVGIAEQDLVGIAAGLARIGKKPFPMSPACFLTTRSYEQCKVDVAYSNTNVKLIGISGGVSYGALGMSHHSCQDIACMSSIPNMRVYLPSDSYQTGKLMQALLQDNKPAYVRVGRNAVAPVYSESSCPFVMDQATTVKPSGEVTLVAAGELVKPCVEASEILASEGITAGVIDMYCIKPFDADTLLKESASAKLVVSVEEHSPFGGLGALVAQTIAANAPKRVVNLSLPDAPVVTGTSKEVFAYYGLDGKGIAETVRRKL